MRKHLVTVLTTGLAMAALAERPGPTVSERSVQGYGIDHPACHAWRDGCVICTRGDPGPARCSTPGVACEPETTICDDPAAAAP